MFCIFCLSSVFTFLFSRSYESRSINENKCLENRMILPFFFFFCDVHFALAIIFEFVTLMSSLTAVFTEKLFSSVFVKFQSANLKRHFFFDSVS